MDELDEKKHPIALIDTDPRTIYNVLMHVTRGDGVDTVWCGIVPGGATEEGEFDSVDDLVSATRMPSGRNKIVEFSSHPYHVNDPNMLLVYTKDELRSVLLSMEI